QAYIAQAIESVLCQQTRFPFEIVIGEDESSDDTRRIVLGYRDRYPERISVILNDRSQVIYVDGRATGRWNFLQVMSRVSGKYIAYLEGDDYWTHPLKLQKQVDFLDAHPAYSLCGHLVETVDATGRPAAEQICSGVGPPQVIGLRDALSSTPM